MAQTVTADAEDFARFVFRLIEERGANGAWLPARDVLEQAAAAYPTHPFVEALAEKPGRRVVFATAAERVRRKEFAHIERKKRGTQRNAPVFYRLSRPMLAPAGTAERTAPADVAVPAPPPAASATVRERPRAPAPDDHPVSSSPAPTRALRTNLRDLRRCLETGASERSGWWARVTDTLSRLVARLQAAVAGR